MRSEQRRQSRRVFLREPGSQLLEGQSKGRDKFIVRPLVSTKGLLSAPLCGNIGHGGNKERDYWNSFVGHAVKKEFKDRKTNSLCPRLILRNDVSIFDQQRLTEGGCA